MRRSRATAAALVVVVAAVVGWPMRARAADPDPWLGEDKTLHFAASSTIAAGGYVLGAVAFDARGHALLCGGSLAALAGISKEALDLAGLGDPSWRDLAWDGIGAVAGLALAWSVDLLVRGVSERRPLFVTPRIEAQSAAVEVRWVF